MRDAFCTGEPAQLASLHDLQVLLHLTFLPDGTTETPYTGFQGMPASSDVELPIVLGHSRGAVWCDVRVAESTRA